MIIASMVKDEFDRLNTRIEALERELTEAKEQMKNNPWCAECDYGTDCRVHGDGTCQMIRQYKE